MMVSSDCMIRVETSLMDELNQKMIHWLSLICTRGSVVCWVRPCHTQQIELVNVDVVPSVTLCFGWIYALDLFLS